MARKYCFEEYIDTNKYSPTYRQTKWVRNPGCDGQCVDTAAKWEYIDSFSYGCSSSSSSYKEKSDIYADGYAFRQQKDTNPDSATYGDTKWVRYSSWDSKCVGEERPVDREPKWTSTGELGCSSSSSSYREKSDPYADGYAFVKYRDTNPNSSSYNDTEWRRASNRDNECKGQTDTSPTWEYVDSTSYSCSSSSSSYKEKTDPYADGYAFRKQRDTNPDSDTYQDTRWIRYSEWDNKCKAEIDDSPSWESTGELGCSSNSSRYVEKSNIYADGYAFVKYKDTNRHSPTYNETEWRRASNRDSECKGQTDTSPTWEYKDSMSYRCSSSASSYKEKTDPYADGYAFRPQEDTNPDSDTYGQTRWSRYSDWDDFCRGKVDDRPDWKYIDSFYYECSSSSSSYKKKTDPYADGYAFRPQKDMNPDSDTYGDTKWVRYSSWDSKCKGQVDDRPDWKYIDSFYYECSSSSSSYKKKTDPYADGYAFRPQKDMNPDSDTYGDTKWVRYSSWDSKCKGQVDDRPTWTETGTIGCSSSSSSYKEKTNKYADGYAFKQYRDTNKDSDTYNQTKWERYTAGDKDCKGETLDCTLSVSPSSISFGVDGSSAGISGISTTSRGTISYQVNKACGGPVTVKYDSNLGSKYSGLISMSNNEDASMTSGQTTVLLSSDSKKIFLDNELSSHAGDVVYTYDTQTVRVPVYVNVTNRPPKVSYIFTTSNSSGTLNNVGDTKSFTITSVKNLNGKGSFIGYDYTVSDNISDYITIDTRSSSESTEQQLVVKYETPALPSSNLSGTITLTQKESGKKITINITVIPKSIVYDCTISSSTSEVTFNIPKNDFAGTALPPKTFTVSLPNECPNDLNARYVPDVSYGNVYIDTRKNSMSSTKKEYTISVYVGDPQSIRQRSFDGILGHIILHNAGVGGPDDKSVTVRAVMVMG